MACETVAHTGFCLGLVATQVRDHRRLGDEPSAVQGNRDVLLLLCHVVFCVTVCSPSLWPPHLQTPVGEGKGAAVTDRVALVPILRAGLGMVCVL